MERRTFEGLAQPVKTERGEQPSNTSAQSLPCYWSEGLRGTARKQTLGDPKTSFSFGGSGEQKYGLQFFVTVTTTDMF